MSVSASRLAWVDNLRTFVVVLVVHMHACVTYSHVGGWYLNEDSEPGMAVKIAFMFWQGHMQAFFMGLLFFLSGVFAHRSLERRGPREFLRERWIRLGLPSLVYMLLIQPLIVFGLLGHPRIPNRPSLASLYLEYLTSGRVLSGNGPMWFVLALLAFCGVLVAWRRGSRGLSSPVPSARPPAPVAWLAFGCTLVFLSFAVRIVQPLGASVLNFQLGYFPQYIAAFGAGVLAGRRNWLETLAASRAACIAG